MTLGQPMFQIKTEVFEGPLDLLLNLVEKRKLFISDISLSQVTDEYISHINSAHGITLENRANFVLIASTLLLVKSKSLLPTLDLSSEEEESIDDLEKRLKILKKYREVSIFINDMFGKDILFSKSEPDKIKKVFAPHPTINIKTVNIAINDVIKNLPKKEKTPKATVKKIKSLEETIDILTKRIASSLKITFNDFSKNYTEDSENGTEVKVNVIVSFLAMLELVKQNIINAEQETQYGDIDMQSKNINLPNYN